MTKKSKILLIIIIVAIIIVASLIVFLKKPETEESLIAEKIFGLSGTIQEIEGNGFLAEVNVLLDDLSQEPVKKTIRIAISNDTKILRVEFPETIPQGDNDPIFPKETEIGFSDLNVGDKVDIETLGNASQGIKDKTSITAKRISVIK